MRQFRDPVTEVCAMLMPPLRLQDPFENNCWESPSGAHSRLGRFRGGPPGAPTLVVRNRRALRRLLWKPGELGMARAWVSGDLGIEGDLYAALDLMSELVWSAARTPVPSPRRCATPRCGPPYAGGEARRTPPLPPAPPPEEVRRSRAHSTHKRTDKRAISNHYDVGNDFYEIVLGPSMVNSCAYWRTRGSGGRPARQLDLICRKLGLTPVSASRVGCGWGSLAMHAAREYGVSVSV